MPIEAPDLLDPRKAEELFHLAQKAAASRGVHDVEVIAGSASEALTRFANNAIHQNVAEQTRHVSIRIIIDQRTARATTNRWDPDAIDRAVDEAVSTARCLQPDPDLPPLFEPEPIAPVERYFSATADSTPDDRARGVREAIRILEAGGQTAAGIFSTESNVESILNSRGVSAMHAESMARFSITAMDADSSGWAKASAPNRGAFDPVLLARRAAQKATASRSPREIEPGRYTVIFEPAAVLDVVGQIFGDFSGTALQDQRSFLTGRSGERLFGEAISITDDVYHPLQAGAPFDGEGVPRTKLNLVVNGTPTDLAFSRAAATRASVKPTGHGLPAPNEIGEYPSNIVIQGGNATIEDMIASTERGILVTRLWYIREVDPYEKIMTGMTRDGTFLVENGNIVCGLRNFRFNQSVIEMLNNVEAMTPEERACGEEAFDMVVPAMKIRDFQFTEVTKF
jgi:predicted Zn-dependent protease